MIGFNFKEKRTRAMANAPNINRFEVWGKGYSFGVVMKCVDVFDKIVAILFPGLINLIHMFGLNDVNEKCIMMT